MAAYLINLKCGSAARDYTRCNWRTRQPSLLFASRAADPVAHERNAFGLLMSLNLLIETPGGFEYTGEQCKD
ncbi:hypothetical protein AB4Y36_36470 [Paraburkholderia sp. BR10936]|uniref:hypothetical protein n=1 Tax=unclassified Paraburkholderia TaxID=2615204 RepID=UPI0034D24F1A